MNNNLTGEASQIKYIKGFQYYELSERYKLKPQ